MGGYGSGRWRGHWARTTVEDCHTLSIGTLKDALNAGTGTGKVWWTNRAGEETASIGYTIVDAGGVAGGVRLFYTSTRTRTDERTEHRYVVDTTTTTPRFGGVRWWWLCPHCDRRCGKLHMPPGRASFRCRLCWDLTYTSCQESHKWDDLYKSLAAGLPYDWRVVRRLLNKRYGM